MFTFYGTFSQYIKRGSDIMSYVSKIKQSIVPDPITPNASSCDNLCFRNCAANCDTKCDSACRDSCVRNCYDSCYQHCAHGEGAAAVYDPI